MSYISVELVRDFDGTYYANVHEDGKVVEGLPEYVSYRTLKKAIMDKIGFVVVPVGCLKFQRVGRKEYAFFLRIGVGYRLGRNLKLSRGGEAFCRFC